MPAPALRQLEGNLSLGPWAGQSGDEGEALSSVRSSLHPELELGVNACSGGVPGPLPLHNPRQPDGWVSLEPVPVGRVRFCAQSVCVCASVCLCLCARTCAHGGEGSPGLTSWMMLETLSQLAGLMFSPPSTRPS